MQILATAFIIKIDATVAQLVEQLIRNQQVRGSSPLSSFLKAGDHRLFLYTQGRIRKIAVEATHTRAGEWGDNLPCSILFDKVSICHEIPERNNRK